MKRVIFIFMLIYMGLVSCTSIDSKQKAMELITDTSKVNKYCLNYSTKKWFSQPSLQKEYIFHQCNLTPYNQTLIFFEDVGGKKIIQSQVLSSSMDKVHTVRMDCDRRLLAQPPHERCYVWLETYNFFGKRKDIWIETPIVNITSEVGLKAIENYRKNEIY